MKALKPLNIKTIVGLISFLTIKVSTLFATHIAGTELTYDYAGGNDYRVTYTLYRDCAGTSAPQAANLLVKSASCNQFLQFSLARINPQGRIIGNVCSGSTLCSGGNAPGVIAFEYSGLITLPLNCSDWRLSVSDCCRNSTITNLEHPESQAVYTEAVLNNIGGYNNSPKFTIDPVYFLCSNQTSRLNPGVIERDGDSLVYYLSPALTGENTGVNYIPGLDYMHPFSSGGQLSMNPLTGDLECHPQGVEVVIIHYTIAEYKNGVLKGTIMRDIQLHTQPCSNTLPELSGVNGSNEYILHTCANQPVNFFVNGYDVETDQDLSISYNSEITNAGFIQLTEQQKAFFSWLPGSSNSRATPYAIHLSIKDNACPVNGFRTYTYLIYVHPALSFDAIITNASCQGVADGAIEVISSGTDQLNIMWPDGIISESSRYNLPSAAYTLQISNSYGCSTDTTLQIAASHQVSLPELISTPPFCSNSTDGKIDLKFSSVQQGVVYSWSNGLTGTSIEHLSAGYYSVVATDENGCTAKAAVELNPLFHAPEALVTGARLLCAGKSLKLSASPADQLIWSTGETTPSIEVNEPGIYTLTVTDENGCTSSSEATVIAQNCRMNTEPVLNVFSRSAGIHLVSFNFPETISVRIFSITGQLIESFTATNNEEIILDKLPSGIYEIDATSGDIRSVVKFINMSY